MDEIEYDWLPSYNIEDSKMLKEYYFCKKLFFTKVWDFNKSISKANKKLEEGQRTMPMLDSEDLEDCFQGLIYKSFKNSKFNRVNYFKFLVVKALIDAYNKHKEDNTVEFSEKFENSYNIDYSTYKDIKGVIEKLITPEDYEILMLNYVDGFTQEEIAEKMHCSVRTIERRIKTVKDKIRLNKDKFIYLI